MNRQNGMGVGGTGTRPQIQFGWIAESWGCFKAAPGTWVASLLFLGAICAVPFLLVSMFDFTTHLRFEPSSPVVHDLALAALVFELFEAPLIYACLLGLANRQVRGYPICFKDLFAGSRSYGSLFVLNLLFLLPNILLLNRLIDGFSVSSLALFRIYMYHVWVIAFLLPVSAMVADGVTVRAALARAVRVNDQIIATAFVFVFCLIMFASAVPCGLGVLITCPMMFIIGALAYRDLVGMPGMATSSTAQAPSDPGQWPPTPTPGGSTSIGHRTEESYERPLENPTHPVEFNE